VPRTELRDAHAFISEFLSERKAYVSGIAPDYFFNYVPHSSRTARAQNPGFTLMGPRPVTTVPPFEAVDYLWFAPSPSRRPLFSGTGSWADNQGPANN
jgi:hypothetical protein